MDNVASRRIPSNPYIVGNPIRSREMFFGREDDFQFVARKIGEDRSNQIAVLCGERRSGKTSILFQILGGRLGEAFLPILIDMQMLAGIKGDQEFFRAVLKAGCTALADAGLTMERLEAGTDGTVEALFEAFLRYARDNAPGRIVLFLLDEYELIEAKVRDGSLSEAAVHYLAGILESPFRVSFIFTGSTNLEDRKADIWKSLLAKSIYRKISYLSEKDTHRLIVEPLKDWIRWPGQVAASIYRLTGGQPFYTQVICQNLVDLLIEEGRTDPTAADLDKIVRDIVDNPLPQMIYSWNSLGEWEQIILSSLGSQLAGPDDWAGTPEVSGFIKGNRIVLPFARERINVLLEEGYHAEFLEKGEQGSYRFRVDLFRSWIRREHSIWKVAKEAKLAFRKAARPLAIVAAVVVPVLLVAAAGWYFLLPGGPRGLARAAAEHARAAVDSQAAGQGEAAGGSPGAETLVNGIVFSSDRGPFQISIDGKITLTSKGRPDVTTIAAPPISKGTHTIDAEGPYGERVAQRVIRVTREGEQFAVVFPSARPKAAVSTGADGTSTQVGTAEAGTADGVSADASTGQPAASGTQPQAASEGAAAEASAPGVLILNTQPPGASITLDGQALPQHTPFAESVPAGEHRVRLALEGFATVDFPMLVDAGAQAKMDLVLVEAWAEITFDVRPTAKISLDGSHILDTPYAKPFKLRSGRHELTIENEALGVKKTVSIDLAEGERRLIQEVLK